MASFSGHHMVRRNFLMWLFAFLTISGCSGGGGESVEQASSAATSSAQKSGWIGRIWYQRDGHLYEATYDSMQPRDVSGKIVLASDSSNFVVSSVNRAGTKFLVYSADQASVRTDFSVRSTIDNVQIVGFSAPYFTIGAKMSDDGKYIAWLWALDYYASLREEYHFSLLQIVEVSGKYEARVLGDVPSTWGQGEGLLSGWQWTPDQKLMLISSEGLVAYLLPQTMQIVDSGRIPTVFGGYSIDMTSVRVSPDGKELAGVMRRGSDVGEIWVANINGGEMRQHTAVGMLVTDLDWSPDGVSLHGGDCRDMIHPIGLPTGWYNWIADARVENLSLQQSQVLVPQFKNASYPNIVPCDFTWTP